MDRGPALAQLLRTHATYLLMQQAGVAVFVSCVRVFAGCANSGQFSKENSSHPKDQAYCANGSRGDVVLGKENVNQISALVFKTYQL